MMQRVIQFITLALFWLRGRFYRKINSRFSHDVTKIQTKKLSLLLSFYFHVILEHLKNFYTNKLSVHKDSSFCDTGRLNFQAFA